MNKFRFGLLVGLASACLALTSGAASASTASRGVVGHVYVNDNTGGVDTIGSFDRHIERDADADAWLPVQGRWSRHRQGARFAGRVATEQRRPLPAGRRCGQ